MLLFWSRIADKFEIVIHTQIEWIMHMQDFISRCDASKEDNLVIAKLFGAFGKREVGVFSWGKKDKEDLVLKEILQQVGLRAIFLNLDFSSSIAAAWQIPDYSPFRYTMASPDKTKPWNLLILSMSNSIMHIFRDENGAIVREKHVRNTFYLLLDFLSPVVRSTVVLLMDSKVLADPLFSHGRCAFQLDVYLC